MSIIFAYKQKYQLPVLLRSKNARRVSSIDRGLRQFLKQLVDRLPADLAGQNPPKAARFNAHPLGQHEKGHQADKEIHVHPGFQMDWGCGYEVPEMPV